MHDRKHFDVISMESIVNDVGEFSQACGASILPNEAVQLRCAADALEHFPQAVQEFFSQTLPLLLEVVTRLLDIQARFRA